MKRSVDGETTAPPQKPRRERGKGEGADGSRSGGAFFAPIAEETAPTEATTAEQGTNNQGEHINNAEGGGAGRGAPLWVGANASAHASFFSFHGASFNGGCTTTPPLSDL